MTVLNSKKENLIQPVSNMKYFYILFKEYQAVKLQQIFNRKKFTDYKLYISLNPF